MAGQIQKKIIDEIAEYIDMSIENGMHLSITELAVRSGYSSRHLQRLFLAETGMPMGKYIRRRRLTRVALLLRLSRRTLQDIALSVGFDCQQSMNRDFKMSTGITPKQYRYSQNWFLSPLIGRARVTFDVSEPEQVYLSGGVITGEILCFYGIITLSPSSALVNEYLACLFDHNQRDMWLMIQTTPVKHEKYHYQVTGYQVTGINLNKQGIHPKQNYIKVSFDTTRDTHIARTHHIYLNILSKYGIIRRPGLEVINFKYGKKKVICTLFIPVS